MVEERELAQQMNYESPIWETIEETHKCYNDQVTKIIENLGENGLLFIGTHNQSTLDLIDEKIENGY